MNSSIVSYQTIIQKGYPSGSGFSILIDSTDYRAYVGLAKMAEEKEDFMLANQHIEEALRFVGDDERHQLLLEAVYNYFKANEYCVSIPFLLEYCEIATTDVANMYNLTSVYNRCGEYDKAVDWHRKILEVDSQYVDALLGIGQHHKQMANNCADSSRKADEAGDESAAKAWQEKRREEFLKSKDYHERAFNTAPDSLRVASEFGMVCYLLADYECAITAFDKMTQLEPGNADNWTYLGDCYMKTQAFDKSARAYEKVVEIEPDNLPIWESLKLLYAELKETENLAIAEEHLK